MTADKELVWHRLSEVNRAKYGPMFNIDGTKLYGPLGLSYTLSIPFDTSTATLEITSEKL